MLPRVKFIYLRHGQTEFNRLNLLMGQFDASLNTIGIQQAYSAASILKKQAIATIISSPLSRALHTAQIVAETLDKPITIIDELKEFNVGFPPGTPKGPQFYEYMDAWRKGAVFPGGESYQNFIIRVIAGLDKALQHEGTVLIIGHGGAYGVVQQLLNLENSPIDNAAPLYHEPLDKTWRIQQLGE